MRGIFTIGNSISNNFKPKFYTPVIGKNTNKNSNFVVIRNRKKVKGNNPVKIEITNVNKEFNLAY